MTDPELEAVEEALNVLALAESESALQRVLTRLLPAVLEALSTKSNAARAKCIETLQHINLRLKANPSVELPFYDVLRVATKPDAAVFTVNIAVHGGYLARCFDRLSTTEKANALPALVTAAVTVASPLNRDVIHRISMRALSVKSAQTPISSSPDLYNALNECSQRAVLALFDYILRALRQELKISFPDSTLVSAVRLASEYAGTKHPERAAKVFPIFLVAAGTMSRSVLVTAAEDALKKIQSADALAAADPSIVQVLFNLFNDPSGEIPVRVLILSKGLLNITLSASCFPEVLDVIHYSLQTPGVPARLQALGMQYVSFVLTNADRTVLVHNTDALVDALVRLAVNETNGSPSFPDAVRGFGFTGLGEFVLRIPSLLGKRNITPDFFFDAAQESTLPASVRTCATQALIAIMRVLKFDAQPVTELRSSVIATLRRTLANRDEHAASARSAAVQWANECFSFSDCDARLLNMLAAADTKHDVRQYALAGLALKRWHFKDGTSPSGEIIKETRQRPSLRGVVDVYLTYVREHGTPHPQTTEAFLKFAFYVLRYSVVSGGKLELIHVSKVDNYFNDHPEERDSFLQVVNVADGILSSWNEGIRANLEDIAISIVAFSSRVESLKLGCARKFANRIDDLVQIATRKSASGNIHVVRAIAKLVAMLTDPLSLDDLGKLVQKLSKDLEPDPSGLPSGRKGEDLRVASIFCVTQIIDRCRQRHGVDLSYSESSPLSRACEHISRRILLPVESTDIVRIAACIGLGEIGTSGPLPVSPSCRTNFIAALSGILKSHSTNSKLVLAAADTIGRVCIGEPRSSMRRVAGETLLTLCKERNEDDIHFVAAESLARAVSGFDAPPPATFEEMDEMDDGVVSSESEILQGVLLMRTIPFEVREHNDDENSEVKSYGLVAAIEGAILLAADERPGARSGGCVCLFTLLRLLGRKADGTSIDSNLSFRTSDDEQRFKRQQNILLSQLKNIQRAFTVLLGDRSDFVQQLASCGLALAYEMCPTGEQHDLVTTLVRSLTSNKSKSAATVPGDQGSILELEGVGTQNGPGDGSNSATYKELCTLAQDMGQPDLVYKFMDLAGHAALWNNRKGVALAGSALLGSDLAAEQLKPHLKVLLPRLYVYCYDPTESVRLAMGSVLGAVIKAAGLGSVFEAVTEHFDIVVEYCLKSMTSRQWRSREAGCSGLRDALSSRTWEQVKEHLQDFWYYTLRALDDIKETVRKAAGGTGRALAQLSVHLCDPDQVGVDIARAASDIVIPAVMSGIMHQDTEIRGLASSTMTKLIRYGGEALHTSVASLVGMLLEAASELEPQMLNYAQFHIDNPEQLEDVRVSAASTSASPLVDSLERLSALVNDSNAEDTVRTMIRLAKVGVGIPTRAATARFFSTMLRTRAVIMESYAVKLMWSAVSAASSETNGMLREAWCAAAGKAVSLCKEENVGKFIDRIVQLAGSEDSRERLLASYLAAALWKHSGEAARKYASAVLPLAYMGAHEGDDTPSAAAKYWTDVWEEGAPSTQAGLRHYAKEITGICEKRLTTSSQYGVKRSAAAALGALANASNESVDVKYIRKAGTALVRAVPGHIWDGKIAVIESIGVTGASYPKAEVWADVGGLRGVVETLLGEVKRGKREYQLTAIDAATKVLKGCTGQADVFEMVDQALRKFWSSKDGETEGETEVSRMIWETGSDASAVDARNRARKSKKLLCVSSLKCLEAASRGYEQHLLRVIEVAESVLQWDWEVRLAAIESVRASVSHCGGNLLDDTSTVTDGTSVLQRIVNIARIGILDAKYASLRKAGLDTLESIARQVGKAKLSKHIDDDTSQAISKAAKDDSDSTVQMVARTFLAQR